MRILHLGHFSMIGGVEALVRSILPAIEFRGHENVVAYGGHPLENPTLAKRKQYPVQGLGQFGDAGATGVASLQTLLRSERPDVACIHSSIDVQLARELLGTIPTIFFAHGYGGICPSGGRWFRHPGTACDLVGVPDARCVINAFVKGCNTRRPSRLAALYRNTQRLNAWLPGATAIICGSRYMADRYLESGIPIERIEVIPLPATVTGGPLRESAPAESVVLFAGRLAPEKGVSYLLKAFSLLSGRPRLLVCGTGPDLEALQSLARSLGISDSVTFLGDCNSMSAFYRGASVVAIPSTWPEPFGLVGPEAMAHGVPVVAFRVGGISEWLSDGNGGYLVEPKDIVGMAARIQDLLDDPEEARRIGQIGYDVARTRFSADVFVDRFLDVLRGSMRTPQSH
jgi:glycosyltransferase involved in cell wall biosynthesis